MALAAGVFLALVGVVVILQRRPLARAQALILGGSVFPGCAVAEGLLLLLIAAAIIAFG